MGEKLSGIIRFDAGNKTYLQQALYIREAVFVTEQGVDKTLECQGDEDAVHYLLFDAGKPVGTARWRKAEKGIKLERFAVLPEYRNMGAGKIILDKILKDVIRLNFPVYLHAQEGAVNFYRRNGFEIAGEMFMEAGIRHYGMVLSSIRNCE